MSDKVNYQYVRLKGDVTRLKQRVHALETALRAVHPEATKLAEEIVERG